MLGILNGCLRVATGPFLLTLTDDLGIGVRGPLALPLFFFLITSGKLRDNPALIEGLIIPCLPVGALVEVGLLLFLSCGMSSLQGSNLLFEIRFGAGLLKLLLAQEVISLTERNACRCTFDREEERALLVSPEDGRCKRV